MGLRTGLFIITRTASASALPDLPDFKRNPEPDVSFQLVPWKLTIRNSEYNALKYHCQNKTRKIWRRQPPRVHFLETLRAQKGITFPQLQPSEIHMTIKDTRHFYLLWSQLIWDNYFADSIPVRCCCCLNYRLENHFASNTNMSAIEFICFRIKI